MNRFLDLLTLAGALSAWYFVSNFVLPGVMQ